MNHLVLNCGGLFSTSGYKKSQLSKRRLSNLDTLGNAGHLFSKSLDTLEPDLQASVKKKTRSLDSFGATSPDLENLTLLYSHEITTTLLTQVKPYFHEKAFPKAYNLACASWFSIIVSVLAVDIPVLLMSPSVVEISVLGLRW